MDWTPKLFSLKAASHRKAMKEVLISAVLSTLPIWLGGILGGMIARAKSASGFAPAALHNMSEFIGQGELYMLAVATLAPIFYIGSSLEKGGQRTEQSANRASWPFPQGDMHRFYVALFITVAAVIFFFMRNENLVGTDYVKAVSVGFYAVSLVMIYVATAYSEERINYEPFTESADEAKEFQSDYAAHRGRHE